LFSFFSFISKMTSLCLRNIEPSIDQGSKGSPYLFSLLQSQHASRNLFSSSPSPLLNADSLFSLLLSSLPFSTSTPPPVPMSSYMRVFISLSNFFRVTSSRRVADADLAPRLLLFQPFSTCCSDDRTARYEAITAGAYVKSRLEETYTSAVGGFEAEEK